MSERKVWKTEIVITVLHEEGANLDEYESLQDIEYEITQGPMLGAWEVRDTVVVCGDDAIRDECIAIGNDGTFFDPLDDDEEEME